MAASSAVTTCAGFVPTTPITGPFSALHLEHLVGEHAVVVVADRREPQEALVLDVLHEEAELVHVRAQHQHGRALRLLAS